MTDAAPKPTHAQEYAHFLVGKNGPMTTDEIWGAYVANGHSFPGDALEKQRDDFYEQISQDPRLSVDRDSRRVEHKKEN